MQSYLASAIKYIDELQFPTTQDIKTWLEKKTENIDDAPCC